MKRKVNLVGQNTLTVSLPRSWAEKYGIKKGSELDLTEKGKMLILNHDNESLLGEAIVDLNGKPNFPRRLLNGAYVRGYDQIKILYDSQDILYKVKKDAEILFGFEITAETESYCILKNVAKGVDSEFDSLLNRLMSVVSIMGKETLNSLKSADYAMLIKLQEHEQTVNKLDLFCRRMINIRGKYDLTESIELYQIIRQMEMVSNIYRDICKYSAANKISATTDLTSLFENILAQYDLFLKMFRAYDPTKLQETKQLEVKIQTSYERIKVSSPEHVVAGYLMAACYTIRRATEALG